MLNVPKELLSYHAEGMPLCCDLDESPFACEFWPLGELDAYNSDYEVPEYAPGFLGFGTSGGGEMFAFSVDGKIVSLPFIGMAPDAAMLIAESWVEFEGKLRNAL